MEAEIIPSIPKRKKVIVVVKVKMKLVKKSDVKLIYCYILAQELLVFELKLKALAIVSILKM